MSKKAFKNVKKGLPFDFAKQVVECLEKEGVEIKRSFVYDLLRGRKKETPVTIRVLQVLKKMQLDQTRLERKAAKLMAKKETA